MPRVTVVIPTFGRADLVKRAVFSALSQTVDDLEVIVVIDGDDPSTVSNLSGIPDPRLRWIAHTRKQGAGAARDTGAKAASGEWVAFLDDDDEWLPTKLERQLAVAPDGPAVIMTLSHVVSSAGSTILPSRIYDGSIPVDEWLFDRHSWLSGVGQFLQTSSLMFPRALFDLVLFTDTYQHEEWELVIRAVKQYGHRLMTVPEALVVYYVPENRVSLSRSYTWQRSIAWLQGVRSLLTPRAYSGFCLNFGAQMAATSGERIALVHYLTSAFRYGAPTARQLFAFFYFLLSPYKLRFWVRRAMRGGKQAHLSVMNGASVS